MSYDWDDDDTDNNSNREEPRGLRKQVEELARKLSERDAIIADLQRTQRARSIADALKESGVRDPERVAKLVPADVADKPEALKTWMEEFKDFFVPASGDQAPQNDGVAPTQQAPDLPREQVEALQRLQTADQSAGTTSPDLESVQLASLQAAYDAAAAPGGGGFDRYIEILRGG